MTRGRCGSLLHIRMTFAFTTPRRFSRRTGEMNDENQVPGKCVDRVAYDGGSCGRAGTRSDAGGEGQGAPVFGIYKEECSGGYQRAVGSTVELQAGAGPLVGGAGDGALSGGGRLYPRDGERKDHDGAGGRARPRREKDG